MEIFIRHKGKIYQCLRRYQVSEGNVSDCRHCDAQDDPICNELCSGKGDMVACLMHFDNIRTLKFIEDCNSALKMQYVVDFLGEQFVFVPSVPENCVGCILRGSMWCRQNNERHTHGICEVIGTAIGSTNFAEPLRMDVYQERWGDADEFRDNR